MAQTKFSKTNREVFNAIVNGTVYEIEDIQAWAQHQIELLDKKSTYRKAEQTANSEANARIGQNILEYLRTVENALSVSQIAKHVGLSTQKTTPILDALLKENQVTVTVEKRKRYFKVA